MNEQAAKNHSTGMSCADMSSGMVRCDETAWTAFHNRYFDWLYSAALLRGTSHGDADDIVQLTCLRVVRHIKVFHHESDFKNWLSCLMRCVVIDRARKLNRRNLLIEKFTLWQELKKAKQTSAEHIDAENIDNALAGLPNQDAQLIRRKYLDGWSTRELAEKNHTTPKAIESKLARLRKQLRHRLTNEPQS